MGLFNFKKKINSVAMQHLIDETSKSNATSIYELFDKAGVIYDEVEVQINVLAINYELCRYALYQGNKKEIVDAILDKVYGNFFYVMNVDSERLNNYKNIMKMVKEKTNSILNTKKLMAPKEVFIYRLLLEQISVKESIIDRMYLNELIFYAKSWINNAEGINKTYIIEDSDSDKKMNESLDFRF